MTTRSPRISREQLLALVAHLQAQGEIDRHALARLLHDEVGGLLAAARMALGRLPVEAGSLASVEQQLMQALEIERRVVESLRPGLLEHFGLVAALEARYEQRCRDSGLRLRLQLMPAAPALATEAATVLYRLGDQMLARIAASGATQVALSIQSGEGQCRLRIRHDGQDAGLEATPEFAGLRVWLTRLGGRLTVRRARDAGLTLTATAPLTPAGS